MENINDKERSNVNQDEIMERVNQSFDHMVQDVKNDVHDNQSNQSVMDAIDETANVFNNNNPWSDQ